MAGERYAIRRRSFRLGRVLPPHATSASGVYAVVDVRKDQTLRLALLREVAEMMRSESRYITEAWLT